MGHIEEKLSTIRMMHNIKKMSPNDIMFDKDGNVDPVIGDKLWHPFDRLDEDAKHHPMLLSEEKKMLNIN